jgi:hypothetical protein
MPGSFSYNAGSNTVTVTGGTSGSPATFGDFVTADRAGTLNSQDARNITGVDGSPVAVTRAIRPVERLVLGGPAHTLYLVITNWNATSATVRIVGTDYDGNAQQEDIAISGNGTLYTVNRYKTITSTQVTALSGTGFSYNLTQQGWGVIWNKGNGQYQLDCKFTIGDGSTSTYFIDILKTLVIKSGVVTANSQNIIQSLANATFQLGNVDNADLKTSKNGCCVDFQETTYSGSRIIIAYGGIVNLYSCTLIGSGGYNGRGYIVESGAGILTAWNCNISGYSIPYRIINGELYNIYITGPDLGISQCSCSMDKIIIGPVTYYVIDLYASYQALVNNIISRNPGSSFVRASSISVDNYIKNADTDVWTITWSGTSTGKIYRQYTFDLHLADINGNPISGATVTLKDNTGSTVFSLTTAADGRITEQTVSRGYYDQAHGSTLQDYGPHTLIITTDGYQDYQDVITIEAAMSLEVAMLAAVSGGGAGVVPTNLGLVPLGIKQVAI